MQPNNNLTTSSIEQKLEVVVGVFDSHEDASRVAASMRGSDMRVQKISRVDPTSPSFMPEIAYEEIEEVDASNVTDGALLGGAIGAGSGLLLFAFPGLNIAAPIVGGLEGAWIGSIDGIDEANRGVELPNQEDYRQMLKDGKSFVVVADVESKRAIYGNKMVELGAEVIHQHPPIKQMVR